ncbi:MAG: TolC family protein [Sulfurimonas sp.]
MKKSIKRTLLLAIGASMLSYADELGDILSTNKSMIFDYQMQTNELESDKLSKSWINPTNLRYSKTYSTQYNGGETKDSANFTVSIDQPIFRSGGIYYAIKYSQALRKANRAEITLQKRMMITDAVTILFNIHKNRLLQKKMKYQIKNDKIDIRQKRDSYNAGLLDSSFLDQAILKKSQDETSLLELELALSTLEQQFMLLSDKKPDTLQLPALKLVTEEAYKTANLELQRDRLRALEEEHNQKITWAKYLPTVSLQGTYIDGENASPVMTAYEEEYYNYGFSVSMPLDINGFDDIEASKVAKLQAATEAIEREKAVDQEYQWIVNNLDILDRKISLAKKDVNVYQSLYRVTKNLADAGEKTTMDAQVMLNTLKIRKLDQKIYHIDKQIELLKLYARMENVL